VPGAAELPERQRAVLAVIYLIFKRGIHGQLRRPARARGPVRRGHPPGPPHGRADARRARGHGLLALVLLIQSRRGPHEALVVLAAQDRARCDRDLIAEGQGIVRACLRRNQPGPYQIQAAINAIHSDAPTAADTDWRQILQLYDQLLALAPSPVATLNRAVAWPRSRGRRRLDVLDDLQLESNYLFHSIGADLLRRLDRNADAAVAYNTASALTATPSRYRRSHHLGDHRRSRAAPRSPPRADRANAVQPAELETGR
jgi:RNA polymerase sigma-70 factor, ECF subfamily